MSDSIDVKYKFKNKIICDKFNPFILKNNDLLSVHLYIGLNDINGHKIYEDDLVKFSYIKNLHDIELIGRFHYNTEELRYEIDIIEGFDYTCLYYTSVVMYDFELIEE